MFEDSLDVLDVAAAASNRELVSADLVQVEVTPAGYQLGYDCVLHDPETDAVANVRLYLDTNPGAASGSAASSSANSNGVLMLRDEESGTQVAVWQYPNDPSLPALRAAAYPDGAKIILQRLGLPADGELTMPAYHPGKRAVLRIGDENRSRYLKVTRPENIHRIRDTHARFLRADVRVPAVLGSSDDGLVALDELPGVPAASSIEAIASDSRFLAELRRLTAGIGAVPTSIPARKSLVTSVGWYRDRLADVLPDQLDRIVRVADAARERHDAAASPSPTTIHGDLHLGQIFVDPAEPWRITGVLDLDTAGSGDPADDLGAMLAHSAVSAHTCELSGLTAAAHAHARFADRVRDSLATWDLQDDSLPDRVTAVTAAHLLAHALGSAARGAQSIADVDLARALILQAEASIHHSIASGGPETAVGSAARIERIETSLAGARSEPA